MDPLATRVVTSLVAGLLGPAGRRLGLAAADAFAGPKDERALAAACHAALDRAVAEARTDGLAEVDIQHVLALFEKILQARGADGVPLLAEPEPAGDAAVALWRRSAADLGLDPDTFAVAFDPLVTRLLGLIPEEVARAAREPGNALFPPLVLTTLRRIDANVAGLTTRVSDPALARLVPLAADLRRRLEIARDDCRAAGRAFITPHLLLVLLDQPDGPAAAAFDDVRPGLAGAVGRQLRAYLGRSGGGRFTPFDWTERADVRLAQRYAHDQHAAAVHDGHLFLGVLDAGANTIRDLAASLGDGFPQLRDAAERRCVPPPPAATPGVVFGAF
jgi:hypothetical protein